MTSRRIAKIAEAIRESVSLTVLFELKDPRVQNVTVLRAEPAPDLRSAKVYVSVMGTSKQQALCMYGLESARGFIQAKLADRLQTRYTPVLQFVLDQGIKQSAEVSRRLKEWQVASVAEHATSTVTPAENVQANDLEALKERAEPPPKDA
ncbi:MAG: hypothetical protein KatS3mg114_0987 [Planctomycetaceae bacterium]|nr:MAG: hypothetical protein KatS3mg114_0987 [Planctomycetaceae bacterium]